MAARPLEVIPITVEVRPKPEPKPVPVSNRKVVTNKKPDAVKKENLKTQKPNEAPPSPSSLPAENNDKLFDFTSQTIDQNLLTATQSDIDARLNKILSDNETNRSDKEDYDPDKFIRDQLAQTAAARNRNTSDTKLQVDKEITSAKGNMDSNFIQFDTPLANDRKLTYAPAKPDFALPNDTQVSVRFKVDKDGNVYDILISKNRSLPRVERIAADYVKNIKFEANGKTDEAEVTLTFKVRK